MAHDDDPIYKYQPLFGSWNIEEEIGEGSFGTVYLVSKEELGQKYLSAVKLITIPTKEQFREAKSSLGTDEKTLHAYFQDVVENIIKEVNILHSLSGNNHILNYHDHSVKQREDHIGWDILIRMEYVTSLPKYLETHTLTREQIIQLGIDICSALEICSKKGIVHRDIKDENIFVNQDDAFKLGDFGIARELSGSGRAASMRGTPLYMAPEVYRGEKYDAAVDIYSLGIVLYKLLNNGRMPFMPPFPEVIKYRDSEAALDRRMSGEELPLPVNAGEDLGRVVLMACAFRAEDRYASAAEMKKSLEQMHTELNCDGREKNREALTDPAMQSIGNREDKTEDTVNEFAQQQVTEPQEMQATEEQSLNKTASIFGRIVDSSNFEKNTPLVSVSNMIKETKPLQSIPTQTRAEQTCDTIHPKIMNTSDVITPDDRTSQKEKNNLLIKIGIVIIVVVFIIIGIGMKIYQNYHLNNSTALQNPSGNYTIQNESIDSNPTLAPPTVNTSTDTEISSNEFAYNSALNAILSLSKDTDVWYLYQPIGMQYDEFYISDKIVSLSRSDAYFLENLDCGFMLIHYFNDNEELLYSIELVEIPSKEYSYELTDKLNSEIESEGKDSWGWYDTVHVAFNNVMVSVIKSSYYSNMYGISTKSAAINYYNNLGWKIVNETDQDTTPSTSQETSTSQISLTTTEIQTIEETQTQESTAMLNETTVSSTSETALTGPISIDELTTQVIDRLTSEGRYNVNAERVFDAGYIAFFDPDDGITSVVDGISECTKNYSQVTNIRCEYRLGTDDPSNLLIAVIWYGSAL